MSTPQQDRDKKNKNAASLASMLARGGELVVGLTTIKDQLLYHRQAMTTGDDAALYTDEERTEVTAGIAALAERVQAEVLG